MTDEFPKNRGGWSGPGRTAAYTLASEGDNSTTWSRKRRFGAEARNKGGHLTVKVADQALDGFYSLGIEGDEGEGAVVRGSATARGSFFLRGPAPTSELGIPQLLTRGNGSAWTLSAFAYVGDIPSKFGPNRVYRIDSYITRDGKTPIIRPPLGAVGANDGAGTRTSSIFTTIGARREGRYEHAMAYPALNADGDNIIAVAFDDGETQRVVIAAEIPGQIIFPLAFNRVGPSTFLGMGGAYFWRGAAVPGYDRTQHPGLFFFASTDGGVTWTTFPAPALTAHEQAEYAANTGPLGAWATCNTAAMNTGATIVPLSRTKALVYAILSSPDEAPPGPWSPGTRYSNARVRFGVADLEAGTVSLLGTLFDPPFAALGTDYLALAFPRWERGACIAPGGGALLFFNDANYSANWTSNPTIYYTATGSLDLVGSMPLQAGRAGVPLAVSPRKLFMPVYDGETHALFESADRGLTWAKRATISTLATETLPGANGANTGPRSFGAIAYLRNDGRAQNATPGAPWLSDDRITPP
ncbi:hypothetical protein J2W32_004481 [Variovorax boronicumulans]|uniref:Exo-alpha-sialidase n=1 Tax=Variovorax boronicumulans TaxID=436515 RepID=A0AAW8D5P7_9BURK|nr:hypothetical protein [Variovorax boronicumulans]MDP9895383.1 hypothetical protein [Variovorax boronicumulans]MDQ0055423.1 hypothetical protein [Variovorax boronicumulans]